MFQHFHGDDVVNQEDNLEFQEVLVWNPYGILTYVRDKISWNKMFTFCLNYMWNVN